MVFFFSEFIILELHGLLIINDFNNVLNTLFQFKEYKITEEGLKYLGKVQSLLKSY